MQENITSDRCWNDKTCRRFHILSVYLALQAAVCSSRNTVSLQWVVEEGENGKCLVIPLVSFFFLAKIQNTDNSFARAGSVVGSVAVEEGGGGGRCKILLNSTSTYC